MIDLLYLLKDLEVPASQPVMQVVPLHNQSQGSYDYQLELDIDNPSCVK